MIDMKEYGDTLSGLLRSSMCEHAEVEYEYDTNDDWPMLVGAICLDCDKDITDELSLSERGDLETEEAADMQGRAIDSAMEHQRDINAGLI